MRRRSNWILRNLVRPVCDQCGYSVVRADEIRESGLITREVVRRLMTEDLVIADITGWNPNVLYELGIRHATGLHAIPLLEESESLPFNLRDLRTINVKSYDRRFLPGCRAILKRFVTTCSKRREDENPVTAALELFEFSPPRLWQRKCEPLGDGDDQSPNDAGTKPPQPLKSAEQLKKLKAAIVSLLDARYPGTTRSRQPIGAGSRR